LDWRDIDPPVASATELRDLILEWNIPPVVVTETQPVELQINRTGLYNGKTSRVINILGRRTQFNAINVFQDICQYLTTTVNLFNEVSAATTYYLVSTSNNDKAGGPGAVTVRIVYLDTNGNEQVTTKTLNGTTPVNIGNGYAYIQWMEVASIAGAVQVSAGDITISSANGVAAEANTVEMIKAGSNRRLTARYKIPTGYTGYLLGFYGVAVNQDMDIRLRAKMFNDDHTISTVYHFLATLYLALNSSLDKEKHYEKIPAGAEIKASTILSVNSGNPRCDINFHFLLIAD